MLCVFLFVLWLLFLDVQKQVQTQSTVQLRLGDEVEMGNSVFKIVLVVPNPNEDEEATTVVEDHDIEQLQNDEEMGDDDDILPHDDEEDAYEQDLDDVRAQLNPVMF
jgi:hypothetical protein